MVDAELWAQVAVPSRGLAVRHQSSPADAQSRWRMEGAPLVPAVCGIRADAKFDGRQSLMNIFEKAKREKLSRFLRVPYMTPYMDGPFFVRGTLPPLSAWPAVRILVRTWRVAK